MCTKTIPSDMVNFMPGRNLEGFILVQTEPSNGTLITTAAADVAVCLLPSDRSGRSFSIRSTEAAASARPGINVHPASSNQAVTHLQAASYFYLRDRDLQQPKAQLQRLSALLKYGTTLAAEAGGAEGF